MEINRLEAELVEKEQKIEFFRDEQKKSLQAIEGFNKRIDEMKARYEQPRNGGSEWVEVVGRSQRGSGSGEGRGGCRSAASSTVGSRPPPQFLHQTHPFCSSSSSSSSANHQRGMLEEGYEEQQLRKSREQEDHERDERHEKRVARIAIEEERERLEQEQRNLRVIEGLAQSSRYRIFRGRSMVALEALINIALISVIAECHHQV